LSDEARKLERLKILEVSGVDRPANELDGWAVMKSEIPGVSLLEPWGEGAGFIAVADGGDFYRKMREDGGEDAIVSHFAEIFGALAPTRKALDSRSAAGARPDGERPIMPEAGEERTGLTLPWRNANKIFRFAIDLANRSRP
jgi:hypothetical protein